MTGSRRPGTRLLVVLGPTGTGKSELAVELAHRLGGEIIGCDALQVYRGLDAATAKPDAEARREVVHHLVDCIDPRTDYSMPDFVRAADAAIAAVAARGGLPLVVGGTGLYLRGLLRGFVAAPGRDPRLRARLQAIIRRGGSARLHAWLGRRDPETAGRIAPADGQRLVRAIELVRQGGRPWSERMRDEGSWSRSPERYGSVKIGLDADRERHGARLDARVDRFFEGGLVEEVAELLRGGLSPEANALKAIGYREVVRALACGEDPKSTRDEVRRHTRRYAKRQRTWFRREPGVRWLDAEAGTRRLADRVVAIWRSRAAKAVR